MIIEKEIKTNMCHKFLTRIRCMTTFDGGNDDEEDI